MSSSCCLYKLRELGGKRSLRFSLCNSSGGKLFLRPSWRYNKLLGRVAFRIPSNIVSNIHGGALLWHTLTISAKKLHCRCSTGFQMCLWLEVLQMWGVGRLQVHGIFTHRLAYGEVLEALDLYLNCASNIYLGFFLCATTLCKWHIYKIVTLLMTY